MQSQFRVSHNHALGLLFARSGNAVFPCCPATKRPLVAGGFKTATVDLDQIAEWWHRWPDALAGLPTSAFWVLDVDAKPSLADSIAALSKALRVSGDALIASSGLVVETPGGGLHLYFRRAPGVAVRTAAGDIAPGVDTRGSDAGGRPTGYILAPGNRRPDGSGYRVISGSLDALLAGGLSEAPRALNYLTIFSKRERAIFAGDDGLHAAIAGRPPALWRATFEAHQAARRPAPIVLDTESSGRMRRYALGALLKESEALAGRTDGRRDAVFRAACRIAKFAAHEIVSADEINDALLAAWAACGGAAKYGDGFARGCIARGLAMGRNDPLPALDASRSHHQTIGRGA